jgi:microsomal prostaglandin-E synthase 2
MPGVVLFQYDICPFCVKTKACLDLWRAPYTVVEVDPVSKRELAFSKDYRKVPVMRLFESVDAVTAAAGGSAASVSSRVAALTAASPAAETVVNSPVIIRRVADELLARGVLDAAAHAQFFRAETKPWLDRVDERLAKLVFPVMCGTLGKAWDAFAYVHRVPHFSLGRRAFLHASGAPAMVMAAKRIVKRLGLAPTVVPAVELNVELNAWANHVDATGAPFHGGSTPDAADMAVFGCVRCLRGLPVHDTILRDAPPRFTDWYRSVEKLVGESALVERL